MIMRWCSLQTNEHDLQAIMYPIICKYHRLNINSGNKVPVFPGYICNRWQNLIVQPSQTHNHGKIWQQWERWILIIIISALSQSNATNDLKACILGPNSKFLTSIGAELWRHEIPTKQFCLRVNPSGGHYTDVIMTTMASQITSLTVVYSTIHSDGDQRKHQSSASLAFVWGIHRDRWIPRTKGQLRGKCFHLMTSSWDIKIRITSTVSRPFQRDIYNSWHKYTHEYDIVQ